MSYIFEDCLIADYSYESISNVEISYEEIYVLLSYANINYASFSYLYIIYLHVISLIKEYINSLISYPQGSTLQIKHHNNFIHELHAFQPIICDITSAKI